MEVFVASIESQLELFTETVLDLDNKFIFGKILHYHRTHVKVQGLGVLPTSWMLMTWEHLKGPGTQKISRSPGGTQTARVGVNSATLQLLFTCSTSKTHTYTFKVGLVGSYPQFMQERCMISLPCFPLKGFKFCLQISSFFPTFVTLALRFPWMLDPNILGGSKNCWWIIKSLVDHNFDEDQQDLKVQTVSPASSVLLSVVGSYHPLEMKPSFERHWITTSCSHSGCLSVSQCFAALQLEWYNILQSLWLFISFSAFLSIQTKEAPTGISMSKAISDPLSCQTFLLKLYCNVVHLEKRNMDLDVFWFISSYILKLSKYLLFSSNLYFELQSAFFVILLIERTSMHKR